MDQQAAREISKGFQAVFEALGALEAEVPAHRRGKFGEQVQRLARARAALDARADELRD